jgi:hypothetical protein
MTPPQDPKSQKAWLLDLLINHYGIPGHVIDPAHQLILNDLPSAPATETETKKQDARSVKSNDRLYQILAYLQKEHGLFLGGKLETDCPIHPWFGQTAKNALGIYKGVFKIVPREHGYLAFTCRLSCKCQWVRCPIHPRVPFAEQRFDPFDLLQVLDSIKHAVRFPHVYGKISEYANTLAAALDVEIIALRAQKGQSPGGLGRFRGRRYPCQKNQLLIEVMTNVPVDDRGVDAFLERVWKLVWDRKQPQPFFDRTDCSNTVWLPNCFQTLKQLGAASRLWLYIWILQQQSHNRVLANAQEFAEALGVTPKTVYAYRNKIDEAGKLTRKQESIGGGRHDEYWTVKPQQPKKPVSIRM